MWGEAWETWQTSESYLACLGQMYMGMLGNMSISVHIEGLNND